MAVQTRHQDQHREQHAPGRDQDRNQQNMGNRDREPSQGSRFDQDKNRDRGNDDRGNQSQGKQKMDEQSRR